MAKPICAITAATSGLGQELSKIFAENGFDLILHARKEVDLLKLSEELQKNYNVSITTCTGDLRAADVILKLSELISSLNCMVLINNAGEPCPGLPLEDLTDSQIMDQIVVNLYSPITLSKNMLGKKGAVVINMNSIMAVEPKAKRSAYCAVRAGLMGFTEAMQLESTGKGIRFIGVYPSRIKSRPEYEFGMDTSEVAKKIFNFFKNENGSKLVIDGRPPEFKNK